MRTKLNLNGSQKLLLLKCVQQRLDIVQDVIDRHADDEDDSYDIERLQLIALRGKVSALMDVPEIKIKADPYGILSKRAAKVSADGPGCFGTEACGCIECLTARAES